jgi:hypothetical protein
MRNVDTSAAKPAGPAGRGGMRGMDTSVATPKGPAGRGGKRGAPEVARPEGFTKKKRTGGIFGLDIIKND